MKDLAAKTARGAGWRAIETAGSEGISFALFVVLARLLLPEHFGIVAMASSIVLSLQCLLQSGLPDALIQREDLNEDNIRSVMSASVMIGLGLVVFTWLIAWPLAWVLGRPEFPPIFLGLSSVLVLQSISFPLHGLLRRELNLRAIAIRTLTATVLGGTTAAVLASQGFGAWSLVAQQIVVAAVGLVMLLRVSAYKPWPFRFSHAAFEPLFSVARPVMLGQFASQAARRLDAVALGLFLGNHEVGIYFLVTRVIQAVQMVTQFSIGEIALAVLSRLQSDRQRLREGIRRALRLTGYVCLLFFGCLSLLAPLLVPVVFGPAMADAAEPLRLLALFATAGALTTTCVQALLSAGFARMSSRLAVSAAAVQLLAVFLAARYGMVWLVLTIGIVQLLVVLPAFGLLARRVDLSVNSLVGDQMPILAGFALALVSGTLLSREEGSLYTIMAAVSYSLVMAAVGALVFRRDIPLLFRRTK